MAWAWCFLKDLQVNYKMCPGLRIRGRPMVVLMNLTANRSMREEAEELQ